MEHEEEDGHSLTSQKIRIVYIMLIGLWLVVFICTVTCHVTLKDRKRSMSGINDHNALWHYRNSHNAKLHVVAVLKQLQRVVA